MNMRAIGYRRRKTPSLILEKKVGSINYTFMIHDYSKLNKVQSITPECIKYRNHIFESSSNGGIKIAPTTQNCRYGANAILAIDGDEDKVKIGIQIDIRLVHNTKARKKSSSYLVDRCSVMVVQEWRRILFALAQSLVGA